MRWWDGLQEIDTWVFIVVFLLIFALIFFLFKNRRIFFQKIHAHPWASNVWKERASAQTVNFLSGQRSNGVIGSGFDPKAAMISERAHLLSKPYEAYISSSGHQALKVFKALCERRHFELTEWDELSKRDQTVFSAKAVSDIHRKCRDINTSYQQFLDDVSQIKKRMQDIFGQSHEGLIKVAQALDRSDVDSADQCLDTLQQQNASTVTTAAEVMYLRSCLAKVSVNYEQCHYFLERSVQLIPNDIFYLFKLAQFEHFLGMQESAIDRFEKILVIDFEKHKVETEISTAVWNELGLVWQSLKEYHKAISYFEKTLASDIKRYGNKHAHVVKSWMNLGYVWCETLEYERARSYLRKAYIADTDLKFLPEAEALVLWNNLACVYHQLSQHDEAIDLFDKVLMIVIAQNGDEHPHAITLWNNLGTAWYEKGDYQRSIDYFEKVLALGLKQHGDQDISVAKAWSHLGTARHANAQFDLSVDLHQKALTLRLKLLGGRHPDSAVSWNELALSWWKAEDDEKKSVECLNQSLTAFQFWGDDYQQQMDIVKNNLKHLRALLIAKTKLQKQKELQRDRT